MQSTNCKILVADDHAVVRKGIIQILEATPDLSVEGEASNGAEMIELVRSQEWDALIMDLHMPGVGGIDLLRQVNALRPKLPVLILTVQPEDVYAKRLLQAGAAGYLTKESVTDELLTAVRKICSGGRFVSQSLAEKLFFSKEGENGRAPHEALSDREFEVLRLLASGMTPTEIAHKLCLSVKTVSTYRARILDKMDMKTNAELMRYAIKNELVD
ncbi:MAG: DNA-binding response regulator [Candidatus Hydrogenedentota bacterium]